mmetsp:Transcript_84430/g.220508  ORF Transcript_84430/g.220508 Transcript_84430/m.220508 type:complete len:250 (-) Transcript_84430:263-1012(-)
MGQPAARHLHGVQVIHGDQSLEGRRVLKVVAVVTEFDFIHLHRRMVAINPLRRRRLGAQLDVDVHEVAQLVLYCLLRSLGEAGEVERQLGSAELPGHETVDVSHETVVGLLPHLKQESGLRRVRGPDLELEHVDDPHEEWHTVCTGPVLQLGLLALHLSIEVDGRLEAVLAPGAQVDVELRQPHLQLLRALEIALGLPVLQLAALQQVALNGAPLLPRPRVNVLERTSSVLLWGVKLQRAKVCHWQTSH